MTLSQEIRRKWLASGGDSRKVAEGMGGKTRQAVEYHLKKANASHPLSVPSVTVNVAAGVEQEDVDALGAFVRAALERAGVTR